MIRAIICRLLIGIALPGWANAQNLVVNPSFEIQSSCPFGMGMLNRATPWLTGRSTPDYLHTCPGTSCCDLPSNYFGYENAATGNGCAGAIFYGSFANYYIANFREFLYGTLSSPLNPGQTYYVSFKVNLVDTASFACNNLGIQFEDAYMTSFPLNNTAHVFTPTQITTQTGWVTIQGTFVPSLPYSHFYVGNFFADSLTSITNVGPTTNDWMAYYYLDDFCVSPNSTECGTFLPIQWSEWGALWQADSVRLEWETEGEAIVQYVVEESWDGNGFAPIETRQVGEAYRHGRFAYRHLPKQKGRWAYYRIRAINANGDSFLSSVSKVMIPGSPSETFAVWPSAANRGQMIHLRIPQVPNGMVNLQWINSLGQTVHAQEMAGQPGTFETEAWVPDIPSGYYFIMGHSSEWKVSVPFLVW